jgi:selenocysteine lyase/cysteine desulfurase
VGWLSVNEPFQFTYELDLLPDARRFEPGSPNSVGIFGLGGALDLILEIGIEAIERRILSLTDLLCHELDRKGYRVRSPRAPGAGERSGIVIFDSTNHDTAAMFERLTQAGIVVSVRSGGLRVSPHVYNTEAEIGHLLSALPPAG